MTPERYRQIGELYHAALEVPAEARAAFLESACAGDTSLRGEVESLIASHEKAGDFMAGPALAVVAQRLVAGETESGTPQQIARYRIQSLLAAGGMGRVFLAEDSDLGRRVALKLLPEYLTHDESSVQRFRQEARAASALNHPNIVTIHEIGQSESGYFIATEFIDGETLKKRMQRAPMTISEILDISVQVASALHAAHEAGIVHRDVKQENIMLRRDGIAKVVDFGLAKLAAAGAPGQSMVKTVPGMVMGTTPYMSPEQARGQDMDARTDLWSFGVVLYEMLARRLPFAGETPSDVVAAVLKNDPPPLANYVTNAPEELQRIVRKCLQKRREERYQRAKDLLIDLRSLQRNLDRPVRPRLQRPQVIAIGLFLLLITLASLLIDRRPRTGGARVDSLAVMPFVNDSQDPNVEYLSDGITDSLINRLSESANLKVMSRNAVFRFKDQPIDAQQVSRTLGVRAVMVGHLRRINDQLVISVELIDGRDGSVIWTHQYIRKMADVIDVQRNVAQDITENLRLKLSGTEQKELEKLPTTNVAAYDLYLRGRHFWNKTQRTPEDMRKSLEYYQRAIELDPNFALAYAELADHYNMQTLFSEVPPDESIPKAKAAVMKALELDDTLSQAHTALGWIKMVYEWDRPGAEREFQRAVELNPNDAVAHLYYGGHLTSLGRFDDAILQRRAALALDPLSVPMKSTFGWTLYFARRYDAAIAQCREALDLEEKFFRAHLYIGLAYEQKGMYDEAIAEFEKVLGITEDNVETLASIAHLYARSGNSREAQEILAQLNEMSKQRPVDPYFVALIHLGLGDKDQAFEWLEKAVENRSIMLLWFKIEPRLDGIRGDPRYDDMARRIGFPSE